MSYLPPDRLTDSVWVVPSFRPAAEMLTRGASAFPGPGVGGGRGAPVSLTVNPSVSEAAAVLVPSRAVTVQRTVTSSSPSTLLGAL